MFLLAFLFIAGSTKYLSINAILMLSKEHCMKYTAAALATNQVLFLGKLF